MKAFNKINDQNCFLMINCYDTRLYTLLYNTLSNINKISSSDEFCVNFIGRGSIIAFKIDLSVIYWLVELAKHCLQVTAQTSHILNMVPLPCFSRKQINWHEYCQYPIYPSIHRSALRLMSEMPMAGVR